MESKAVIVSENESLTGEIIHTHEHFNMYGDRCTYFEMITDECEKIEGLTDYWDIYYIDEEEDEIEEELTETEGIFAQFDDIINRDDGRHIGSPYVKIPGPVEEENSEHIVVYIFASIVFMLIVAVLKYYY